MSEKSGITNVKSINREVLSRISGFLDGKPLVRRVTNAIDM
jgi:hypothetical protein